MSQYILFVFVGLGVGSIYAALAMGLVVTYKGTGVINFAQGAMAMYGAYVYDELRKTGDLVFPVFGIPDRLHLGSPPFIVCFAIGILFSALLGLLVHYLVFRPLRAAPVLGKVVASVGVMLTLQALVSLKFDSKARAVTPILPHGQVHFAGLVTSQDRFYLAGIAVLIAAVLWAYFRFSRLGLATRAAAENELGASLSGFSPDLLAGMTWVLSSTLTGTMVILASPTTGLNPINYTLYVVPALAVALVGRLSSISIVCAAGLILGSFQAVLTFLTSKSFWPSWAVTGFGDAIPFAVVIVALFVLGTRLPTRGAIVTAELPEVHRPRNRPPWVGGLVVAGFLVLAFTHGSYRFGVVTSMIMTIVALSLVVLTGMVGQISLAQAAFAGSAGFVLAKLGNKLPFPITTLVAALAAAVLGVLIGIPALRIRGAQLAVVTLAGAIAIEKFVFRNPKLVGTNGDQIPNPKLFGANLAIRSGTDITRLSFCVFVLVVLTLVALAVANLARGDTGRAFLAVRSNERAAAAAGISVSATKLLAFGVSSFLAGIGGALIGYSRSQLSADSFAVLVGVSFLAFAYLGGITSISGALVAGTFAPLGVGYVILDRNLSLGKYYLLLSGLSLVVTAIFNPQGIAGRTRENNAILKARLMARRSGRASPTTPSKPTVADEATASETVHVG
ncbi:MAG: ABC transporter permease [Ilumatobacteraceae bacterium]